MIDLIAWMLLIGSVSWMACDSAKHQISFTGSTRRSSALVWFVGGIMMWMVFFPLYLFRRSRVLSQRLGQDE
jgi:hypothetical protein